MTHAIVGVDISKDWLDAHRRADGKDRRFANTKAGRRALIGWSEGARVAFEPSGRYHRALERHLAAAGIGAVKINPLQVRRFAEAVGCRAKTDAVDARLIAAMAAQLDLPLTPPLPETTRDLKALQIARHALVKDRTAVKNRAQSHEVPIPQGPGRRPSSACGGAIGRPRCRIASLIANDEDLARRRDVLISIPGVSAVTAAALLAEAPELGTLEGKAAASLAGLAPMTRQSGTWNGRAMIRGGRAHLRHALYMPALVAARFNPDLKAIYQRLISAGKPPKVALTALMRKLVILANALIRDGRHWSQKAA